MRWQSRQPKGLVGQIRGLLSQNVYSKRESWTTALSLTEQGHKQPARENTTDKKELLTLSLGNVAEGS
jgi:hypothetical protein